MTLLEKLEHLREELLSVDEFGDRAIDNDGIDDAINRIIEDVEAIQEKLNSSDNKHLVAALDEARNMMEPRHGRQVMSGMYESVSVPVGKYTLYSGKEALIKLVITSEEEELEDVEDVDLPDMTL